MADVEHRIDIRLRKYGRRACAQWLLDNRKSTLTSRKLRHRHWYLPLRSFCRARYEIDAQVPEGLDIHIVMDNYATHKTPKIKSWLARRPYYHVHFTPTSASWINQVERWFAELARKRLRRGVHTSVRQLEVDIRAFIDRHNKNPRPFK
jgi:hypothetical protein